MAIVKPFLAYRPESSIVDKVAALPYDVYNRQEAKVVVEANPLSFLAIDRAETAFDDSVDTYAPCVYAKAKELLDDMMAKGQYIQDSKRMYYIYELIMEGRHQTGIVACASIDDYMKGVIKKHENTREEKEIDRITHVDTCNAQTGPIFLAYRARAVIDEIVSRIKQGQPLYAFTSDDGITHNVWLISSDEDINTIQREFDDINEIYIADGHHRAASAVKVGLKRRAENPATKGDEEYNFFLSVLFPHNQLKILPYNRVIKDLNGYTKEQFLARVSSMYEITEMDEPYMPEGKSLFGMYLSGRWYKLRANGALKADNPVDSLDVSILQNTILGPILGIDDPRTDRRIDFVGGIRGLGELEKRAESDMMLAFSMYPTSIEELFDVADEGLLMPPKSTWFEPKLRSGIFIHKL